MEWEDVKQNNTTMKHLKINNIMKNLKFYFSVMFILIAMVCSVALNMTYMEKPEQNMYKFILAISTLLSTILWINYMIERHEQA